MHRLPAANLSCLSIASTIYLILLLVLTSTNNPATATEDRHQLNERPQPLICKRTFKLETNGEQQFESQGPNARRKIRKGTGSHPPIKLEVSANHPLIPNTRCRISKSGPASVVSPPRDTPIRTLAHGSRDASTGSGASRVPRARPSSQPSRSPGPERIARPCAGNINPTPPSTQPPFQKRFRSALCAGG